MIQATSLQTYRYEVIQSLGERQKRVYEALQTRDNFTNSELSAYLDWPINTVTPRIFELRQKNLVDEDAKRTCRVTGRTAIAWHLIQNTLF